MVLDGHQRPDFAAGLVGNSARHCQLHQLALRASIYSAHHRFSSFESGRYPCPAGLLDFSGRIDLDATLVWYCTGRYRIGPGCKTGCTDRGTPMSFFAFFLIVVSLLSFVVAQLILKRAMELSARAGLRHPRFVLLVTAGRLAHDGFVFHHAWIAPTVRSELSLSVSRFERDFHHDNGRGGAEGKIKCATPGGHIAHQRRDGTRFTQLTNNCRTAGSVAAKSFPSLALAYESSGQSFSIAAQLILRIWSRGGS